MMFMCFIKRTIILNIFVVKVKILFLYIYINFNNI